MRTCFISAVVCFATDHWIVGIGFIVATVVCMGIELVRT